MGLPGWETVLVRASFGPVRLLIATVSTQGHRPNDFNHCRAGELVMPPWHSCDEPVDGPCGCRRSLVGVDTHGATTTFAVADVDISFDDLATRVRRSLTRAGWIGCVDDPEIADKWVHDIAWELVQAGAQFAVGGVFERRGPSLVLRA